jgi:hypothetical protein
MCPPSMLPLMRRPQQSDHLRSWGVVDVLAGFGIEDDQAIGAARAAHSAVHGFVLLESQRGFGLPPDPDASFAFLVDRLAGGLEDAC